MTEKRPKNLREFIKKLKTVKALNGWLIKADQINQIAVLRYPKTDKKIGPKLAKNIRSFLNCNQMLPEGVRLSIRLKH